MMRTFLLVVAMAAALYQVGVAIAEIPEQRVESNIELAMFPVGLEP
jgi:hypothetical protein